VSFEHAHARQDKHSVEHLLRQHREPGDMSAVFVVDDDRAIHDVMRDILQETGMRWTIPAAPTERIGNAVARNDNRGSVAGERCANTRISNARDINF
jgi:hypothetical protein